MNQEFQVTIRGNSLTELKNSIAKLHRELSGNDVAVVKETVEDVSEPEYQEEEVVEVAEDEVKQGGKTLDSNGMEWNAAIHASSKATNKDGSWKLRKGVDKALVESIRVQARQQTTVQAPVVTAPPVFEAPAQPAVQAPVVTAPSAPPVQPMTGGYTLESFIANFPLILSQLLTQGKVSQEYIQNCKSYFGVIEIWNLNDNQKTEMFNNLVQYQIISKVG